MNKKAARTPESHNSMNRSHSVCGTVLGRVESGLRFEKESCKCAIIELYDFRGHDSTVNTVIRVAMDGRRRYQGKSCGKKLGSRLRHTVVHRNRNLPGAMTIHRGT